MFRYNTGRIKYKKLKKVFKILGISHVMIALVCMLIGVIVEFHQVHIYKNNISFWHLQATKTISKDSKKIIKPVWNLEKVFNCDFDFIDNQKKGTDVNLDLSEMTIYSRNLFDLITSEYAYDKALRGPPVVS